LKDRACKLGGALTVREARLRAHLEICIVIVK
jgi:hypothetical protein